VTSLSSFLSNSTISNVGCGNFGCWHGLELQEILDVSTVVLGCILPAHGLSVEGDDASSGELLVSWSPLVCGCLLVGELCLSIIKVGLGWVRLFLVIEQLEVVGPGSCGGHKLLLLPNVIFSFFDLLPGRLIHICCGFIICDALDSCDLLSTLLEDPVIDEVIFEVAPVHEIFEQLPAVVVVWLLLELESPAVVQIKVEFFRQSPGEALNGGAHFLLLYPIVFLVFVLPLEALPGQSPF